MKVYSAVKNRERGDTKRCCSCLFRKAAELPVCWSHKITMPTPPPPSHATCPHYKKLHYKVSLPSNCPIFNFMQA